MRYQPFNERDIWIRVVDPFRCSGYTDAWKPRHRSVLEIERVLVLISGNDFKGRGVLNWLQTVGTTRLLIGGSDTRSRSTRASWWHN